MVSYGGTDGASLHKGAELMNGYLIEKYSNMGDAYTCHRLVEEAKKKGIDLTIVGVYDCIVTEEGVSLDGETLLPKRDFVINRYKWGKVKDALNRLGSRCYNETEAFNIYINKYEQVCRLKTEAVLMPQYRMGNTLISFDVLRNALGLPFVAKGLESSMGQEILKIDNESDYKALKKKYGTEKEWLFEEFISFSYGRDMRFYSIRGEVVAAMERRSAEDFRANVALGGSVRSIDITEEMKIAARDIYEQTGLDFLGIDLLYGDTKPYFCEINVMPGLEGIETASGLNIAEMIIDTIKGDF